MSRVAVDTNILVRLFIDDDPAQRRRVTDLFASHQIIVLTSVVLETSWVLGKTYGFSKRAIADVLRKLSSTYNLEIEHDLELDVVADMIDKGMDVADAVHLASASDADWFASFDKSFVKAAAGVSPPVRQP